MALDQRGADSDCRGAITGRHCHGTDITELHAMQEQMKTFIHLVSHDLRAPLTIINGYVELFKECLAEDEK